MNLRTFFLSMLSAALCLPLCAIEPSDSLKNAVREAKPKVEPYGFVRNYFCFDSHKSLQYSGEMFNMIPLDRNLDEAGEDLNAVPSMRMLAITSHVGVSVEGFKAFDANLDGKVEVDFQGFSGAAHLARIRLAYVDMEWKHSKLLIGQDWHPMSICLVPDVLGLATGAPFNPFSRTPQVRFDCLAGNVSLTAAALYQLQYASAGPNGISSEYANDSCIPELYGGVQYKGKNVLFGAGIDFLSIMPRTSSKNSAGATVKVRDRMSSFSPMLYGSFSAGRFALKTKALYAENTSHLFMMSGYGAVASNSDGSMEYAPLRSISAWTTVSYGTKWKAGVFGGFVRNLGLKGTLVSTDELYVRGFKNIAGFWRIAPEFSVNLKHFSAGIEYEVTTVSYGSRINADAMVSDTHDVANHRICAVVKYVF
jgi:hypothetical protein